VSAGAPTGVAPWSAAAVRAGRGPKAAVDPWRPIAVLAERERAAAGGTRSWLTVFLAGAECSYTCVFCDLWRHTLDGATPPGAVPAQIAVARAWPGLPPAAFDGVKLYNASNFFDQRAVPAADDPAILAAVEPFGRVLVECHPRLVGRRALGFAGALAACGATLEVAMGFETIHPRALPRLGKALTLAHLERAAADLLAAGAAVRAFVLVGAPWVPSAESTDWTVATARAALAAGATHISLIPVRGGNGTLEELARRGEWTPPTLADLEVAFDRCLAEVAPPEGGGPVVTADLWDLERLARCPACATARRKRLESSNASGVAEPPVLCAACGGAGG
jgi:archaeosine synthase beta-subunit